MEWQGLLSFVVIVLGFALFFAYLVYLFRASIVSGMRRLGQRFGRMAQRAQNGIRALDVGFGGIFVVSGVGSERMLPNFFNGCGQRGLWQY